MALPLDDILKAIARGGGAGAQIARGAMRPTQVSGMNRFLSPVGGTGIGMGKFAGKGLLAGYKPPQTAQHERREGPGGLFGAALTAIDLGRGIMTSTIKESIDLLQGEGFDPGEWWNQATTQYGFGELIHDERNWVGGMMIASSPFTGGVGLALGAGVLANNIWADRVIGFIGDVAVDPLMYMGGFGAFARGAGYTGAVKQLDDLVRAGKVIKGSARETAVNAAYKAVGDKKSLSAGWRALSKEGDAGAGLIKELGWAPGARIRVPMTGPFGRALRKAGGTGDRVWDIGSRVRGKPSWITRQRTKQIPEMYHDMMDGRQMWEMVEAFQKGGAARRAAMKTLEREIGPQAAGKLARVAGQAAKAPLEIVLKGLPSTRKLGAAGLGGRFIGQVADFPIRGTQKITPEKMRDKVALLFDPNNTLRPALASGDAELISKAVGTADAMRFAAGKEKIAERGINRVTQNLLNWVRRRGISDESMTAMERRIKMVDSNTGEAFAVRGDDLTGRRAGEVIDVNTSTNWFQSLPADVQELYVTNHKRFVAIAREADQYLDELDRHALATYGDDFGDDVLQREAGARYSGHRQVNRDFQQAIWGEKPPDLQGRRGYPVRGRRIPGSTIERGYRVGGPLAVKNPDLLPPVVGGRTGVVPGMHTAGPKRGKPMTQAGLNQVGEEIEVPIWVLADESGAPFRFEAPGKVGMSFDEQVNRVTQQTFGKKLYEDRFSMLSHLQTRNLTTDIKLYAMMRKLNDDGTITIAGPDELRLGRAAAESAEAWDELGVRTAQIGADRIRLEEQAATMRANEAKAAGHAANRRADAARLSDKGVAAHDAIAEIDIEMGNARTVLLIMEEELGLLGTRSAKVNDLQARTRALIEQTDKVSQQKKIRGKMLSERDDIIAEVEGYIRHLDDVEKLVDELVELRAVEEAVIRADIGPQPAPASRMQPRTLEADLLAARETAEPIERAYTEALAVHTKADEAVKAAEAAYKENVYKALGARPAAERTAAVAKELEAKTARTAIPDIDVDPWVRAARDELADAETGLKIVERDQQELLERIAAIEASPGFAEEGTRAYNSARLATAPLYTVGEQGLSVKNPLVHTKDGAVRRGALRARQDMLTERLRVASDELDEAIIKGTDDALERDLTRTIPNRPDTPEVRARTAEIKRLKEEITGVQAERDWLQTQSKKGPFPTAELTGRPGAATANARAVKRAIEARKIERPTSKYTVARKELKDAENSVAQITDAGPEGSKTALRREIRTHLREDILDPQSRGQRALESPPTARRHAGVVEQGSVGGPNVLGRKYNRILREYGMYGGDVADHLSFDTPVFIPRTGGDDIVHRVVGRLGSYDELEALPFGEWLVARAKLLDDVIHTGYWHSWFDWSNPRTASIHHKQSRDIVSAMHAELDVLLRVADTHQSAVYTATDRVDAAKRALAEMPREEPMFRPEGVGRVDEPVTPTPQRTLRQTTIALRRLRKELRGSLFADAADRRAQAALQGRRWEGLRYRAADRKKIIAKRGKVATARKRLDAEKPLYGPHPLESAQAVVETHTKRSAAKETMEALGRELEEVRGQAAGMMGTRATKTIPAGRLPAAQQRVQTAAKAATEEEARALRSGGPVVIVGKTDPRVRDPRLFAVGPEGQGLIRISRPADEFGDDFALLRAKRAQQVGTENAWEFTHLETDLLQARPGQRTTMGARIMRDVRADTSPGRASRRQQGWRFFDEDVAEGSTRISGEATAGRRAATEAARPLREATEGAAEAQRVMGQTVPPRPEAPPTTYANRAALNAAFAEDIKNVKEQIKYVRAQLELVNASLYKFAEEDVTTQAVGEMRALFEALSRGVGGAEGTTASARVNRWIDLWGDLDQTMRAVDYERTLGVEGLPDLERRLTMFNERIAEIADQMQIETRLEDVVADLPGLQKRVPRVSADELQELRGQFDIVENLQAEANRLMGEATEAGRDRATKLGQAREWDRRAAKNRADVAALEAGAMIRQVETEVAIMAEMEAATRARTAIAARIVETTTRLDRDRPFILSTQDKDVRRAAIEVERLREGQGMAEQRLQGQHRDPLAGENLPGPRRDPQTGRFAPRESWLENRVVDGNVKPVVRDRPLSEVLEIAFSVEPRVGYAADSVQGKLFTLRQKERALAQEYLKSSLSTNEWGPWTLGVGDPFTDDMHHIVRAFANINDPSKWDGAKGLWKTWDNFQTYLKAAMIATPGFVNRNIFGAFFNAWLDDVNPAEIMRSLQMTLTVAKRAQKDGIGFYSAAKKMAVAETERLRTLRHPLAKEAQANRFKEYVELLDVGVRGGGQAVRSVELEIGLRQATDMTILVGGTGRAPATAVSLAPWSPRFVGFQSIRSLNSWVEDIVRLGVGMDTMRWGGTVDDALKRIAKTQFDYDELTSFERTWMRRFFPFYTWTRKNVPYQLNQLARNPAKFNKILAGKRNLELGTEEEDIVPDYFLEPFGVRTPFKYKGATVYSAPDFPFQDLARYDPFDREGGGLKEAAQNVMSMLTPILKAPLESAFGKQMYNGVPFTGRYQLAPASISKFPGMKQALQGIGWIKQGPSGEWKMRDHHIYLITNMLPTLGVLRRLAPNEPKYQRAYLRTLMSTLGGVSASFNTDQAKHNWLTNLRYERQEERQEWKDLTSQTR